MNTNESAFSFERYRISESSIIISNEEKALDDKIKININPSGLIKNDLFILTLDISISTVKDTVKVNVVTEGEFKFSQKVTEENTSNYFCVNAPAILFPYIRAYISTLTALSGIDPLILPTLNLTEMGETLKRTIVKSE